MEFNKRRGIVDVDIVYGDMGVQSNAQYVMPRENTIFTVIPKRLPVPLPVPSELKEWQDCLKDRERDNVQQPLSFIGRILHWIGCSKSSGRNLKQQERENKEEEIVGESDTKQERQETKKRELEGVPQYVDSGMDFSLARYMEEVYKFPVYVNPGHRYITYTHAQMRIRAIELLVIFLFFSFTGVTVS